MNLKPILLCLTILITATMTKPVYSQDFDVLNNLERYQWENRLVLIFAPDSNDPKLEEQYKKFSAQRNALHERETIVFRIVADEAIYIDDELQKTMRPSIFFDAFDISETDFKVLLIGYDGRIKKEYDSVAEPLDIFKIIDSMPIRQMEMKSGYND